MFPIMDVNNRVIGFGGRVMKRRKAKVSEFTGDRDLDKKAVICTDWTGRTSRKPYFLVCEGYMDDRAASVGIYQCSGVTGNCIDDRACGVALIKRYVQEVYLTYDSDEAGRAALRAVPILKEAGITAKVIRMDPYKDPDEFIKKNLGAEEFEQDRKCEKRIYVRTGDGERV